MNQKIEYEYRFYDINEEEIKNKIIDLGGKKVHDKILMTVKVFNHPLQYNNYYIRLRNEHKNNTLTVKKFRKKFPVEHETIISNPKETEIILKMLGCEEKYTIEKIRETWFIEDCKEIVFDSYVGIPTFIEIECNTKEKLDIVTKKLGLDIEKSGKNGIKNLYYKKYGIPKNTTWSKDFKFVNGKEIFENHITKNKDIFINIFNQQLKYLNK